MNCPRCESDMNALNKQVTVEIKGYRISYLQKSGYCHRCGEGFFSPEQLNENSIARKKAYDEAKKNITYK